ATRLLSGSGGPLEFAEPQYCVALPEDTQIGFKVIQVNASHKHGLRVRYSITGGNRDGLFTINQSTGQITLSAQLDHELHRKHELVVSSEAIDPKEKKEGRIRETSARAVHTIVQVTVLDVNDNPPEFTDDPKTITVIEEDDRDLATTLIKIVAKDPDLVDVGGLVYSISGDGVDGLHYRDHHFAIDPRTGEIRLLRPLDRDPPKGRAEWKLKVKVRDGQARPASTKRRRMSRTPRTPRNRSWTKPISNIHSRRQYYNARTSSGEYVKGDD
ncbi:unnamed protein product, partial [Meganyctiphanes norvegica]